MFFRIVFVLVLGFEPSIIFANTCQHKKCPNLYLQKVLEALPQTAQIALNDTNVKGLVIGRGSLQGVDVREVKKRLEVWEAGRTFQENDEKVLDNLQKINSVEAWFFLDPEKKEHRLLDSEEKNVSLLGSWPLNENIMKALRGKFEVVVLDTGVLEHIYEDYYILKIYRKPFSQSSELEKRVRAVIDLAPQEKSKLMGNPPNWWPIKLGRECWDRLLTFRVGEGEKRLKDEGRKFLDETRSLLAKNGIFIASVGEIFALLGAFEQTNFLAVAIASVMGAEVFKYAHWILPSEKEGVQELLKPHNHVQFGALMGPESLAEHWQTVDLLNLLVNARM